MPEVYHGRKVKTMDVLWGAWIKNFTYDGKNDFLDILGIYDTIYLKHKRDYPHITDLRVVIALQAFPSEYNQVKKLSLKIIDIDGQNLIAIDNQITVPELGGVTKLRWYEDYTLENVIFREPGYYELGILINDDEKQNVPLWVHSPKMLIVNPEDDSTLEKWID